MSQTVSFRCSQELNEFLEQEAERRMTTKSTVAQMIVADYAQEHMEDSDGETEESARQETLEGVNNDGPTEIEFGSKETAKAVRDEYSEHLDSGDDGRFKTVVFASDTPSQILKRVGERSGN